MKFIGKLKKEEWEAKIKAQGLHLRHDHQLEQINLSLTNKIPRVQQDLNDILRFPDAKRKEIYDSLVDAGELVALPDAVKELPKPFKDIIDAELQHELDYYQTKWQKLSDICTLIAKEKEFRALGLVERKPIGTIYYVDFDNGHDINNDGTTATKTNGDGPWATLDKFCENARSAGDKAIVRRGMTQAVTSDLTFISDGAITNPIILEADFDDAWGDEANSVQTYTLVFGSKALLASGNPDFVVSEWMYENTEDNRKWAYEVAGVQNADNGTDDGADSNKLCDNGKFGATVLGTQVVNTTDSITGYVSELVDANIVEVTLDGRPSGSGGTIVVFDNGDTWTIADQIVLFLPYKGAISGAGKTLVRMPYNPIWNTAAGNYQLNIDNDHYWKFQGLHLRGTDTNGIVELDSSHGLLFKDMVFEGFDASDHGIEVTDDVATIFVSKCRSYDCGMLFSNFGASGVRGEIKDCLMDGGGAVYVGLYLTPFDYYSAIDCEFRNHASGDIYTYTGLAYGMSSILLGRCLLLSSATEVDSHDVTQFCKVFIEDFDQTVGDNRQLTGFSTAEGTPIIQSDTTDVRVGGGATSIKCTPSDKLATVWELSRILLFEYPIYAVKDVARTYTVYFKSDDDTDWDADPLNTELWIEAEYWNHATNPARTIKKSTGVCNNFDADDTVWDSLTVTVTPLQTGVLYLRGYYCKAKEAGNDNIFFCDTKIGIA